MGSGKRAERDRYIFIVTQVGDKTKEESVESTKFKIERKCIISYLTNSIGWSIRWC